jgi:hypothetical protein
MRKLALTLTVALVVGGCTSETEISQEASLSGGKPQTTSARLPHNPRVHTGRAVAFASLPDRGTLLAFDRGQKPTQRGAYTYHAVQLSEAHALNAAAEGKSIDLPLPSGETMRIAYQRHEEALDGNWSWIGKTKDGLDAVITFGEGAVFGRIYQKDTEAYSLTMSGGRSWLVQTDPSKLIDGNLGRDAGETDALIPPSVAAAVSAKKLSAAASVEGGGKASAANTVDVALGYTNGLVTKYGSAANVNTRLSNLMAITNQGYVNSLITPRVRLVRTVQVNYTDSNTNELALEALTGYDCTPTSCTQQPVPAELVPLRTARDEYGADLVSLVRPFQAPQHQGCGIAWLLGGGGFAIDNTDAPFGYSIVSDGNDQDETDGRNYFCREETLAHELGHNMGQQHNTEDSGGDSGTHSYSYGYRETLTTGFYTVMAYRLANSSQSSINYFGNPNVNYLDTGRPTGTATADNARSLNIAMPLVAQFRNVVVPFIGRARFDLNNDGRTDLLWRNGNVYGYWYMNGGVASSTGYIGTIGAGFKVVAAGDFNGDGFADLAWSTGNQMIVATNNAGNGYTNSASYFYGPEWQPYASADVDGDGKDDILWRQGSLIVQWLMDGGTVRSQAYAGNAGTGFVLVAVGDFDGNGSADFALANGNQLKFWLNNGSGTYQESSSTAYGGGWSPFAALDLNADGKSDLIWRNQSFIGYWYMNGATATSTGFAGDAGAGFQMVAAGDYNNDGVGDLIFANGNQTKSWQSTAPGQYTFTTPQAYGDGWSPFDPLVPSN